MKIKYIDVLVFFGCSTTFQVCASSRLFSSALIASSHFGQSGHTLASSIVVGSRPSVMIPHLVLSFFLRLLFLFTDDTFIFVEWRAAQRALRCSH